MEAVPNCQYCNKSRPGDSETVAPPPCSNPSCFFCNMKEPNPSLRRFKISKSFRQIPRTCDKEHVLVLSTIWNIAMSQPDDHELPSLGLFDCMTRLIHKAVRNAEWLLKDQNIYIPYYAAHIIGSYTMNKSESAKKAVESGAVTALLELLRGKISWIEQRVAARAIGHLASHDVSFEAVAVHEAEIVELAMDIAENSAGNVYRTFLGVEESKRIMYQSDLLTRGLGGSETENRKAEEWTSQLQCWSLYILNCFLRKERSIDKVCRGDFLNKISNMWGGLVNRSSPGGLGLIKTLCKSKQGRHKVAESREVVEALCNISRSSDDWQFMAIETLLMLVKDPGVRLQVLDLSVTCLVDLAEDERFGCRITQAVLQDYHKIRYGGLKMKSRRAQRSLEELWELKVEKRKKEKLMSELELEGRRKMVSSLKKKGNKRFWSGDIGDAVEIYTTAIDLCPMKMRQDRVVLYSNRAQCFLLMKKPESAIGDATRALCLSGATRPHRKSLWRRSQAYDMRGCARQSLMDCLRFVDGIGDEGRKGEKGGRIPYYAARMIGKQMRATWPFREFERSNGREEVEKENMMVMGRRE